MRFGAESYGIVAVTGTDPPKFSRLDRFDAVDATAEAEMFVRFLERVESQPDVVARRRRTYELLDVRTGQRVAEVGSGLGTAAGELAALGLEVIGFDTSAAMVTEARRRTGDGAGRFEVADAAALPLEAESLDGYRAERVYQHIDDPVPALAEARRVLGPGARIVLVDQDWDTFVIDADDRETTRAVLRAFSDSLRNGWIGRRYRGLLTDAGFEEVIVEADAAVYTDPVMARLMMALVADTARTAGTVDPGRLTGWLADQERRCDEGRFFCAMTHFLASARTASRPRA